MMKRLSEHGQLDAVKGFAILLIMVAIFAFAFTEIRSATIEQRTGKTYQYENSLTNAGTAYLTINAYDEITSGKLKGELKISASVVVSITLNGTTIVNKTFAASENVDNTVTGYLKDGSNSWTVTIDNTARLTAPFKTTLTATTYDKSLGETIATETESGSLKVFVLLLLVVLVAIIAIVLRYIGVF
jgi:hypothetical protein